jgi:putative transposase
MPSTDQRRIDRGVSQPRVGAGGEPPGEPTAPPSEILDRMPDEIRRKLPDEVVDELLAGARTEEEIVGPGGLLSQLTQRLVERALEVELTDHVGYERHQEPPGGTGNTRNGSTSKTLITEHGRVGIDAPRDRDGSFEPRIVKKRQRRFEGFDDKILALYSRGLSTRDIEAHIAEIYGVHVGRDLISRVTDAVMEDARAWQQRPLDDIYPVVFLDALVLKIREGGSVQRRACYLALGVGIDGTRDVLGMWFQEAEGAKFWMQVLSELRHRGISDILIACVDGLKGFPEAIEAVFPKTTVQTCIVHLIRNNLKYVPRREFADVTRDLKPIYTAIDSDAAHQALEAFDEKWGARFPVITQAWLEHWEYVTPFGISPGGPSCHIHDKCHRGPQPPAPQSRQDQRAFPERGRRPQAALSRNPKRGPGLDQNPELDDSPAGLQDPLRRPPTRLTKTRLHRKRDTLPSFARNAGDAGVGCTAGT